MHSEAISAGELKHGPLALVDKSMPLMMIITRDDLYSVRDRTVSVQNPFDTQSIRHFSIVNIPIDKFNIFLSKSNVGSFAPDSIFVCFRNR